MLNCTLKMIQRSFIHYNKIKLSNCPEEPAFRRKEKFSFKILSKRFLLRGFGQDYLRFDAVKRPGRNAF